MGLLIDGKWQDKWYNTASTGGKFVRKNSSFRNWVTPDGSAGPTGRGGFKAEADRYHLYVSLACPWAHRAIIMRKLKGLQDIITMSVVNAFMGAEGWTFDDGDGVIPDTINTATHLHHIYTLAQSDYTGRVTVPILWDKKTKTIVSNESSEIIRMMNNAFDQIGAAAGDYYPKSQRGEIDTINDHIYFTINNGVYKAGFATTQGAYEEAVTALFNALDELEETLSDRRYLLGDMLTEADIRLFTTLVRFDAVYVGHFKCNIRRIEDYPMLSAYVRDIYQHEDIGETVNIAYTKAHYYGSHNTINPTAIIPVGPYLNFNKPHNRNKFS